MGPVQISQFVTVCKVDVGRSMISLRGQKIVLRNKLSLLEVPTLLVWGAEDTIVPASHAYAAVLLIPDSQLANL